MGHSAPLATRSGWVAIAIMPFMMFVVSPFFCSALIVETRYPHSAFATKVNWVTVLTGTSHEKLQVFHRWAALIMCESPFHRILLLGVLIRDWHALIDIPSLIHSFIFIWNSVHRTNDFAEEWKTSSFYWTGVAALVPQVRTFVLQFLNPLFISIPSL